MDAEIINKINELFYDANIYFTKYQTFKIKYNRAFINNICSNITDLSDDNSEEKILEGRDMYVCHKENCTGENDIYGIIMFTVKKESIFLHKYSMYIDYICTNITHRRKNVSKLMYLFCIIELIKSNIICNMIVSHDASDSEISGSHLLSLGLIKYDTDKYLNKNAYLYDIYHVYSNDLYLNNINDSLMLMSIYDKKDEYKKIVENILTFYNQQSGIQFEYINDNLCGNEKLYILLLCHFNIQKFICIMSSERNNEYASKSLKYTAKINNFIDHKLT